VRRNERPLSPSSRPTYATALSRLGPVETQVSNWIKITLGVLRIGSLIGWTLARFGELGGFPMSVFVLVKPPWHVLDLHRD
jgi:hypothetical protein